MIVRFGLELDGMQPSYEETRLGFVMAGPATFLTILENQLGIIHNSVSEGERIVQYRSCLADANSPERFYHQSFDADDLGVARKLLYWRDSWYMAGWGGTFTGTVGKRLQDMADVEVLARRTVSLSFGERLAVIIKSLETRRTQIIGVELVDDPINYPSLWGRVLDKFLTVSLNCDNQKPCGQPNSDLDRLQKALCCGDGEEDEKRSKVWLSGDGSVVVLHAGSRAVSARLLADYLKTKGEKQSTVLAGAHGFSLDEALESIDLPKCGFQPLSVWRPPMQILSLALALLWKPLDPEILSQFLNLPMAPIPRRVRAKLAPVVTAYPGIGGPAWCKTIESLLVSERKDHEAEDKQVSELSESIEYWLACARFDPDTGAPIPTVSKRCKRVAEYLAVRAATARHDYEKVLFAYAHRQAADLAAAVDQLGAHGMTHVFRQQLERLLAFSIGTGSPLSNRFSEVGHVPASESPAVFIMPQDEVIWWDFSMPALPVPHPWTQAEMKNMADQGLCLPDIDRELLRIAKTWLRPIRYARKRLVLVLHATDENHHPLWDQINSVCEGWIDLDIEAYLQRGESIPGLKVKTVPMVVRPLPPLQRWWHLPDGRLLIPRAKESYSSLDAFIKSPYQWVLGHKARFYTGGLDELTSGNRLKGNLVHRLIEYFFRQHPDWIKMTAENITAWMEKVLPQLLEEEGATLLTPGMAAEKEAFSEIAKRSLLALVKHLSTAHVKDVQAEKYDTAKLFDGELGGYIDLLLIDDQGKEAVIDVKWGGYRYREDDLRKNLSFQLAVYAYLRKKSAGLTYWPAQANFIISGPQLLTQNKNAFPDAIVVASESGEGVKQLWERFVATWHWRRAQLDQGLVEVTVQETEPTLESSPPENGLSIDEYNDAFNDYAVLTGWGPER